MSEREAKNLLCYGDNRLHQIQDPAGKLSPTEEVSVVRHMVGQQDWRRATTAVEEHK